MINVIKLSSVENLALLAFYTALARRYGEGICIGELEIKEDGYSLGIRLFEIVAETLRLKSTVTIEGSAESWCLKLVVLALETGERVALYQAGVDGFPKLMARAKQTESV